MLKSVMKRFLLRGATSGVREAMYRLRGELQTARKHRAGVRQSAQYRGRSGLRLNLGCGTNVKPGWVNVDLLDPHAELSLDLREPWPFSDGSASVVYSEHFFEHLEHPTETGHFLGEALRVLETGGRLSIVVPDTEWPLRAYVLSDEEYFRFAGEHCSPECRCTRMHQINFHFRQHTEHRYAYDHETLAQVIAKAGFTDVTRREFDPDLDSEFRRIGSLYVDAKTPMNGEC